MESALWQRIAASGRAEIDERIAAGRHIQAVSLMRELAGVPVPGIHECVDLVGLRLAALRLEVRSD